MGYSILGESYFLSYLNPKEWVPRKSLPKVGGNQNKETDNFFPVGIFLSELPDMELYLVPLWAGEKRNGKETSMLTIPIFFYTARIYEFPVEQLGSMAFLLDKALVGFPFWYGLYSSLLLKPSSVVKPWFSRLSTPFVTIKDNLSQSVLLLVPTCLALHFSN